MRKKTKKKWNEMNHLNRIPNKNIKIYIKIGAQWCVHNGERERGHTNGLKLYIMKLYETIWNYINI